MQANRLDKEIRCTTLWRFLYESSFKWIKSQSLFCYVTRQSLNSKMKSVSLQASGFSVHADQTKNEIIVTTNYPIMHANLW